MVIHLDANKILPNKTFKIGNRYWTVEYTVGEYIEQLQQQIQQLKKDNNWTKELQGFVIEIFSILTAGESNRTYESPSQACKIIKDEIKKREDRIRQLKAKIYELRFQKYNLKKIAEKKFLSMKKEIMLLEVGIENQRLKELIIWIKENCYYDKLGEIEIKCQEELKALEE